LSSTDPDETLKKLRKAIRSDAKLNDHTMRVWMGKATGKRAAELLHYSAFLARYQRADTSSTVRVTHRRQLSSAPCDAPCEAPPRDAPCEAPPRMHAPTHARTHPRTHPPTHPPTAVSSG
jgi:hypothetical protein